WKPEEGVQMPHTILWEAQPGTMIEVTDIIYQINPTIFDGDFIPPPAAPRGQRPAISSSVRKGGAEVDAHV
ncbi:MAG: hypothetical protein ABI680_20980, partial [Chthoniobacteraceae bacterium]